MTASNECETPGRKQRLVNYWADLATLLTISAMAASSTLTFWFAVQYLSAGSNHAGILIPVAFIALLSSYYGILPLANAVHVKVLAGLSRLFRLQAMTDTNFEGEKKGS